MGSVIVMRVAVFQRYNICSTMHFIAFVLGSKRPRRDRSAREMAGSQHR